MLLRMGILIYFVESLFLYFPILFAVSSYANIIFSPKNRARLGVNSFDYHKSGNTYVYYLVVSLLSLE